MARNGENVSEELLLQLLVCRQTCNLQYITAVYFSSEFLYYVCVVLRFSLPTGYTFKHFDLGQFTPVEFFVLLC
jgi:hypothetical protein